MQKWQINGIDFFLRILSVSITLLKSIPFIVISSNIISLTGEVGAIYVQASQKGNTNYYEAESVVWNFNVIQDPVLSVEDQNNTEIAVWPIPATNEIQIRSQSKKIIDLTLLDALGRVINIISVNNSEYNMDIRNIPNGIYILQIKTDNRYFLKRVQIMK